MFRSTRSVEKKKKKNRIEIRPTFFQLFLFHLDEILPNVTKQSNSGFESTGCSTVYVNGSDEVCNLINKSFS